MNRGRIIAKTVNAPVIFAFKAGSGVTGVAVTAGERIAAKTLFQIHFIYHAKWNHHFPLDIIQKSVDT